MNSIKEQPHNQNGIANGNNLKFKAQKTQAHPVMNSIVEEEEEVFSEDEDINHIDEEDEE